MDGFKKHKIEPVVRVAELINAASYSLPKNFRFPGESHDFWELIYVDRGQILLEEPQGSYLLKAGEMVFYAPNVFHAFRMFEDRRADIIVISFDSDSPAMETFGHKILVPGPEEKQCLSAIVREAAATYVHFENIPAAVDLERAERPPFGSEQIIANRLEELLIRVCRRNVNIPMDSRAVSPAQLMEPSALAARVRAFLETEYDGCITLERLAQEQNVSISYLRSTFKIQTGTTIKAYLAGVRIREAKRLIQEGNLNFSQIAEAVGYDGIYYFSSVFKKKTGMTMTEYSRSVKHLQNR